MVFVTTTAVCISCHLPHEAICLATETDRLTCKILNQINNNEAEALINKFDQFEESFGLSSDFIDQGRKFLQSFVDEMNAKYNLAITLPENLKRELQSSLRRSWKPIFQVIVILAGSNYLQQC